MRRAIKIMDSIRHKVLDYRQDFAVGNLASNAEFFFFWLYKLKQTTYSHCSSDSSVNNISNSYTLQFNKAHIEDPEA